jgi:glycosyltransferase involved in cell wall biosynthesis
VLPGYPTPYEGELQDRALALGLERDVRFVDWVSDGELEGLWEAADAFVFPSLYEGFGLPVLEAMARGVPVACSNASSLPEVAGDAAILFEPHDEAAIAAAIERLLGDESEAARLRAAGLRRAGEFSWERTARATFEVYRRALA